MDANLSVKDFITVTQYHRDPNAKRMPDCAFSSSGCKNKARWIVAGGYMCTAHKEQAVKNVADLLEKATARPEGASDEDMELLELLWEEIEHEKRPQALVEKFVKELSLPDGPSSRNLASWYLWWMGIINIRQRVDTYEFEL